MPLLRNYPDGKERQERKNDIGQGRIKQNQSNIAKRGSQMNTELQLRCADRIEEVMRNAKKKELLIKLLDSNPITRFLFGAEIRLMKLESIRMGLEGVAICLIGMADCEAKDDKDEQVVQRMLSKAIERGML